MKFLLFKPKYPKLMLLVICIIAAYLLFKEPIISDQLNKLQGLSYLGILLSGMLYSFGFTAPFAVGFFVSLNPSNIYLAACLGGLGSVVSDMFIFDYIRFSFKDEFDKLKQEKFMMFFKNLSAKIVYPRIKKSLSYLTAAIIIGSPLPDEIGVIMLAGLTKIKPLIMTIISFLLNTVGILIVLLMSH